MSGMSNGLMGLLGTALIVGSAAAGANYIGSGPKSAEMATEAAAVIGSLTQVTGAVVTGRLLNGGVELGPAGIYDLVRDGYLASLPRNPTNDADEGLPVLAIAHSADGSAREIIQMRLWDVEGELCDEIARQATGRPALSGDTFPLVSLSCIKTSEGSVAFSRV